MLKPLLHDPAKMVEVETVWKSGNEQRKYNTPWYWYPDSETPLSVQSSKIYFFLVPAHTREVMFVFFKSTYKGIRSVIRYNFTRRFQVKFN